jgi:CDGSH-type Zn-finger protein
MVPKKPWDFILVILPSIIKLKMATTKITVKSNGSLKIEGDFEIVDIEGNVYGLAGREAVSICRCGLSQTKPFCDGSHKGHFEHDAKAFDLPPKKIVS